MAGGGGRGDRSRPGRGKSRPRGEGLRLASGAGHSHRGRAKARPRCEGRPPIRWRAAPAEGRPRRAQEAHPVNAPHTARRRERSAAPNLSGRSAEVPRQVGAQCTARRRPRRRRPLQSARRRRQRERRLRRGAPCQGATKGRRGSVDPGQAAQLDALGCQAARRASRAAKSPERNADTQGRAGQGRTIPPSRVGASAGMRKESTQSPPVWMSAASS